MSTQVTVNFTELYRNRIDMLVRQRGSRFRQFVTVDDAVVGKRKFTEQVGAGVAVKKTTRHGDTPLTETPHARRAYDLSTYEYADLIDWDDRQKLLIALEGAYAEAASDAMGHAMDDQIVAAATGDSLTGESGGTTTTLVSYAGGNHVVLVGDTDFSNGANVNMTVAKARRTHRVLMEADNDMDARKFFAISPVGVQALLNDPEVTSADYNIVKPLASGELVTWMGFTWIPSNRLALSGNVRTCFAWVDGGIELGIGVDRNIRVTERPDKSHATQVYAGMVIGSTRLQEAKVVSVAIDESAGI